MRSFARIQTGVLLAALLVGCSLGSVDPSESSGSALEQVDDAAELDKILGNERVARALRANLHAIPQNLAEFENLLKVGRACPRPDSKEIFVVEEKSTRIQGFQEDAAQSLPRLVIGGCNENPSQPGSERKTFELFVAMVSDKAQNPNDSIALAPNVEAMVLDDTTGLYNFYIMEKSTVAGQTGTVTRIIQRADGAVEKWQKVDGKKATKQVVTDTIEGVADRKCFNCHVHGDPIMSELTEPWSNWVSSHHKMSRQLSGESRSLVTESRPFSVNEHNRSSLANVLEQVTRAGIAMWIEGLPGVPGSGLGAQVLSGQQPGGVNGLLKSTFCQTQVNYASTFETVPVGLFMDEMLSAFAAIEPPIAGNFFQHTLLPVRSETDKRIERFLQKQRILTNDTVLAVRLVDDKREIFSNARCGLFDQLPTNLGRGDAEAAVRQVLKNWVTADSEAAAPTLTSARRTLIRALLDGATPAEDRDAATEAYMAEVNAEFNAEAEKLDSASGRRELETRWTERQASARGMFPNSANPLPLTTPHNPPTNANR